MNPDSKIPDGNDDQFDDTDLNALIDDVMGDSAEVTPVEDEATAVSNVVSLLPAHAAPYAQNRSRSEGGGDPLKIQRRQGRPRKVERAATTSDLEYHAQMSELKARFIDRDAVVQASVNRVDPLDMISVLKTEVAKEAAALHFQRIENEKFGKDTAQVSTRRIDALKKIADIELEIKKIGGANIDVRSEKMTRIFKFFIDTVKAILEENLKEEQIDLVFNRLETDFQGWQDKLADILR